MNANNLPRFFYRKIKTELPPNNVVSPQTSEVSSTKALELPQNSLKLTAHIINWLYRSIFYSLILFVLLVWGTAYFNPPVVYKPEIQQLIDFPDYFSSHSRYLKRLINTNRLDDAKHELVYVQLARKSIVVSSQDKVTLKSLESEYSKRDTTYQNTVRDYAAWSHRNVDFPHYRDGLYLLSQRSYILFDEDQTRRYLEESVSLDPQFQQGADILRKLNTK